MFDRTSFLAIYSGVVTAVAGALLLSGFTDSGNFSDAHFRTLTVQRIDIVEPDGTLRMVLSNHTKIPGAIFNGHEYSKSYNGRDQGTDAGILFYDGDATESGGLTFGGGVDASGVKSRNGHLSFDAFDQDQMFTIDAYSDGTHQGSSIQMLDRPSWSVAELLDLLDSIRTLPPAEQQTRIEQFYATHASSHVRTTLGTVNFPDDPQQNANVLVQADAAGQARVRLGLDAAEATALTFLDANGAVVRSYPGPQ